MQSTMQDYPLTIAAVLRHDREHGLDVVVAGRHALVGLRGGRGVSEQEHLDAEVLPSGE